MLAHTAMKIANTMVASLSKMYATYVVPNCEQLQGPKQTKNKKTRTRYAVHDPLSKNGSQISHNPHMVMLLVHSSSASFEVGIFFVFCCFGLSNEHDGDLVNK
jgi:cytochrome bd-type quinol oxidase subunit 1